MGSKVSVVVFSYNRYSHLRLCLGWFLSHLCKGIEVTVRDDGSTDGRVRTWLEELFKAGKVDLAIDPPKTPAVSKYLKETRLGIQRSQAVDRFLEGKSSDYLMLLDDDILVAGSTVLEAVADYELLEARGLRVGAYTLHAWLTAHNCRKLSGKVFAEVTLTGESCLLMSRQVLQVVGNHFGPGFKEFADRQFEALRKGGYEYYTRVSPPYQVQHLGVGQGGSSIYRGKLPSWVLFPYKSRDGKYLKVDGFDVSRYLEILNYVPADRAPLAYLGE